MFYLVDTDVVISLTRHNLLGALPASLGVDQCDIYLGAECRGKLRSRSKSIISIDQQEKAKTWINGCSELPRYKNAIADQMFDYDEAINGGEKALIAVAVEWAGKSIVVTGDMRAIETLATEPGLATLASQMQGRVLTRNQALVRIIKNKGWNWMVSRVNGVEVEECWVDCFAGGDLSRVGENGCLEWLNSTISKERARAPALLVPQ